MIELMIVMAIIGILATLAIPSYVTAIKHAREAVLKEDLHVMRAAIDSYTMDKQKAPQSLDDLVTDGYLKVVPEDPMTHRRNVFARRNRARRQRRPLRCRGYRLRRPALLDLVGGLR
jgi:general secretion pathway protein G